MGFTFKKITKAVGGSVKTVAKGAVGGVTKATKFVAKKTTGAVKDTVKFVDKNSSTILGVGGAIAGGIAGAALLGPAGAAIGGNLGGGLMKNSKQIAKGNLSSVGGTLLTSGLSGVTAGVASGQLNGVIGKAVGTGVGSKIANVASTKVGSTAIKATSMGINAKQTVSKVMANNPVTSGVAQLSTGKIAQMTTKAVEAGKVNVNSVKQTLEKAQIPATVENVKSLTNVIQASSSEMIGKKLPAVSQMTKTEAKSIVPNYSKMVQKVSESGVIDMKKIEETVKETGIEAKQSIVEGIAEALNVATPHQETPKINGSKVGYYVAGGVGLLGLLYLFFKNKR